MKSSVFRESSARSAGFQLNFFGNLIDTVLHRLLPKKFSNLLVVVAEKD